MGFINFPMDEFGVVSEKLRMIAKQPEIPKLFKNTSGGSGKTHQWLGASVKNVETLGEQSAAGLSSISGVILLNVPEKSTLAKYGFHTGDVIIKCQGRDIKNFEQLKNIVKDSQSNEALEVIVIRNQEEHKIKIPGNE